MDVEEHKTENSWKDTMFQVANIFAVISVPLGLSVGGLLMGLRSDVEVIKTQLVEQQRVRTALETLQTTQQKLALDYERLKGDLQLLQYKSSTNK